MRTRAGTLPIAPRRGVRLRTGVALALLLVLLVGLGLDAQGLRRDRAFNESIQAQRWEPATQHPGAHGHLASAYLLHRSGDITDAIGAYGQVFERDGVALWLTARYDLATLYLEQAQGVAVGDSMRVPLIELAKQLYRELLRVEPYHWDARYNLSRALELLPDVGASDLAAEENPERAPRAAQASPAYEVLP